MMIDIALREAHLLQDPTYREEMVGSGGVSCKIRLFLLDYVYLFRKFLYHLSQATHPY